MKQKRCPKCGSEKRTDDNGKITCTACGFIELEKAGKNIIND